MCPTPRVVLLGASNLVRGLACAVDTARRVVGAERLDVHVAHGHGRSYGQRTRMLGRGLPGILDCGLWRALERNPAGPLYALLTDIGNDIAYGAGAATLAGWVDACAGRLAADDARLVMTPPPTLTLERLRDVEIAIARRFFFPTSKLTPADVRREVAELDARLRESASRHGAAWVDADADWYGLDPIHVRRSRYPRAWARMLAPWADGKPAGPAPSSALRQLWLWWKFPERWHLFGVPLGSRQPAAVLPEGVRVFFY